MISLVYDSKRYHEVLSQVVKPGDIVIEIGPHVGNSTSAIAKVAKKVIAVDKAVQAEAAFKKNKDGFKNVTFVKADVRFFDSIEEILKITKRCDVFAIDMGGGRFPDTVFKVWAVWSGVFKPRDSVIRNKGIGEFIKRVKIMDPCLEEEYDDAGWLLQAGRKTPKQLKEGIDELKCWLK